MLRLWERLKLVVEPSGAAGLAALLSRRAKLHGKTDILDGRVHALWNDALAAANDTAPTWIHGDLHPRNVLVKKGCLTGVIDWGDLAGGDRACDLAAVWMLLPQLERTVSSSLPSAASAAATCKT